MTLLYDNRGNATDVDATEVAAVLALTKSDVHPLASRAPWVDKDPISADMRRARKVESVMRQIRRGLGFDGKRTKRPFWTEDQVRNACKTHGIEFNPSMMER